MGAEKVTYRVPMQSAFIFLGFGVVALTMWASLIEEPESWLFFACIAAFSGLWMGRSLVAPAVVVTHDEIMLRELWRTRRIPADTIVDARTEVGYVYGSPLRWRFLVIETQAKVIRMHEFNARPRRTGPSVERAASAIRAAARAQPPSGEVPDPP